MKKLKVNIPIRIRLMAILSVVILTSIISGIAYINVQNSLSEQQEIEQKIKVLQNTLSGIKFQFEIKSAQADTMAYRRSDLLALSDSLSRAMLMLTDLVKEERILEKEDLPETSQIMQDCIVLKEEIQQIIEDSEIGNNKTADRLNEAYMNTSLHQLDAVFLTFSKKKITTLRNYAINLLAVFILSILLLAMVVFINAINTGRNLTKMLNFTKELEKGNFSVPLDLYYGSEFIEISRQMERFRKNQEEKIHFLRTIGEKDTSVDYSPSESDILGNEIKVMARGLEKTREEENRKKLEEEKRNWINEGLSSISDIFRTERNNMEELSFRIISKLVSYLEIEMGSIFLMNDQEEGEELLKTIASYAYDRRKYLNKSFKMGEGLPGTCAQEREKIYIDEIPDSYSDVISGVGQSKPKYVLLVPLKTENELLGVLELASFREIKAHEQAFIDQIAESIASTLQAVKINERTTSLLKQSQEQAEQLLLQEEKMKQSMQKLESAREESIRKESELTGIINAMNESSLVAEFSLTGKFTHINEKFCEKLESPADQILGKPHHEFAVVDKYSNEYKGFWEKLRTGQNISREELFKLYSGKEIWLQQTFTPIRNPEGNVYKVLNIAIDITNSRKQQDNLMLQNKEIDRQHREMESLKEAVDKAIIKCELDHEGIIIDANKNFESTTGYGRKEFLGRNYRIFLKEAERKQFDKIWDEIQKGKTFEGATRRTKPTGEELWLMSTFSPVSDEKGRIYKVYLLALDITEKKLKYQLLEEANKEIERLKTRK